MGAILIRNPVVTRDQTSFEEAYEQHVDVVRAEKTRPFPAVALQQFNLNLVMEDEFVLYAPRVSEADKLFDRKSLERSASPHPSQRPFPVTGDLTVYIFCVGNRALQKTLHLIVKTNGQWAFPSQPLPKLEDVKQVCVARD